MHGLLWDAGPVLSDLRGPSGGPNLRTRIFALLVVTGLVVATAPLVVFPLIRFLAALL